MNTWHSCPVDNLTTLQRSALMRRIKAAGTKPERIVWSVARKLLGRICVNARSLPGRPDVARFRSKQVVFVHGCFWHQHARCTRSNVPKSNRGYWVPKLKRNVQRDVENGRALRRDGWRILVVWECQCRDPDKLERRLRVFFDKSARSAAVSVKRLSKQRSDQRLQKSRRLRSNQGP
jgi:DNA mismatch endonuclease (patch repair protein)